MTIAFTRGGIIPARHASGGKDTSVAPHEPVKVPEVYGKHLVADKFAYVPIKKKAAAKDGASGKAGVSTKPANASGAQGASDTDKGLDAVKSAVTEAEDALANAETDEAKAAAQTSLDAAIATLSDAEQALI
ncbi:hypothetical protein DYI23_05825 [Roseibium polysiphoniae]|uniref:Uncharacterized protein n=2 Tax=Roseibium polysiphoniae TaxID=2571221 RepID=A0A944GS16_9HYPH|nr:hypothetical protein [Roseibium polysiphoniae]